MPAMTESFAGSKRAALAGLTLLCVAGAWLLHSLSLFQILELRTLDYRFRLLGEQASASPDIVLVEVDELSIKTLEPEEGRWPWRRDTHALLVDYLKSGGARLVVFDILFTEADVKHPESDEAFAESAAEAGNVVQAVFLHNQDTGSDPAAELLDRCSLPWSPGFTPFRQAHFPSRPFAESCRALGHVAMTLDPDGPWRRSLPLAAYRDRLIPSIALASALAAQEISIDSIQVIPGLLSAGAIRAPLDRDGRLAIWFNGGPGTYPAYSYGQLFYSALQLENDEEPLIDPSEFKDKIVLVGLTAAGLHDVFTTPYSGGVGDTARVAEGKARLGKMAGVEVHANILDNLLTNRYLRSVPFWVDGLTLLLLAIAPLTLLFKTRLKYSIPAVFVVLALFLTAAQFAFGYGRHIAVVPAVLAWAFAVGSGLGFQYWTEGREKRKIKGIFSRYVSKDVYQELMNNPAAARLGGTRMFVTVLFSDLRGFTSLSERTPPERVIAQLNEYFSAMVEIVFQNRGTIDKFVGDMIMAIFNAPLPDPDHADHAVNCAVEMNRGLDELNRKWKLKGQAELRCGVGINSGEMIVGNVGAESIRSYTVIGDQVNLGARLESLCKEYSAEIIISESTRALLKRPFPIAELGEVKVKGKEQPVRIYRVLHSDASSPERTEASKGL
jgi:adenylate cyclase